jgi:hypothetical protein
MQEHEHRDIPVKVIGKYMAVLLIMGVLIVLVVGVMWRYFGANQPEAALSPFYGPRELPPTPRLQIEPRNDLRTYLENEQRRLSTYGWVDQNAGVVHIPIERAMDLLLERGLPTRQPAVQGARQPERSKPEASKPERSKPVVPAAR